MTKRTDQTKRGRALRLGRAHSDYVIGQHWLSVAYERICAGEDEMRVMEDYGYYARIEGRKP